jgi:dipeptidyl aminopeptidase/acylaminoacyl peptidase
MTMPIEGGAPKDLTPGDFDVPTFSLGGPDDYAISPDGAEVAYVANTDKDQATSTNTDIFVVPTAGGDAKRVTTGLGADRSPVYSPDGNFIAYRSQTRPGYESDRWRLLVYERANFRTNPLNESQDRNVEEITWSADSTRIFYTMEDRGRTAVHMMPASGGASRVVITGNSHIGDVQFTPDGRTMVYSETSGSRPAEIYRASSGGGTAIPMTRLNDTLLAGYHLTALEEFWVDNPNDKTKIHSFLVKPPNFSAGRKYPLLFLIHGGPQGAWGETWSYRWNPQVFASAGYVVVMPNPRGSTGYGQRFTDEINQDWGGKVYEDLMAVLDHAAALRYVDPERMAAAGGSYGGYMVNWMLGHNDRFKAFVSHAGVFDLRSMAGETEELWFPFWEFRGMPWDNPEVYAKWSPSYYVRDFKTPTLVMHGELDYRVPVGQGMQLFTALQLQKVPSKIVLFPDEGHWILKPQNSAFWYKNFLEWIDEWTQKKPSA